MKTGYKLGIIISLLGILVILSLVIRFPVALTSYLFSDANTTIYTQDLNLIVDDSQIYMMTSFEGNLDLESLSLEGNIIGNGRAEIFLENDKGEQYLVYENVKKEQGNVIKGGITGMLSKDSSKPVIEKKGVFLAIQPKEKIEEQFSKSGGSEELVSGAFNICEDTCNIPEGLFNSQNYNLIFKVQDGTLIQLNQLKYSLHK